MATFTKEINFISPTHWNKDANSGMGAHEEKEVSKLGTFRDLSRTDRSQHDLHFMIMAAFEETKGKKVKYDSSQVLKMTDEFIETSMLTSKDDPSIEVTEADKTQFLNDSIAKLNFGLWLLNEKFAPFFSQLGKT